MLTKNNIFFLIKKYPQPTHNTVTYYTSILVFFDMLFLVKAWYHIRSYPVHRQTTHTNARTARTNKLLLTFRVEQLYKVFGKKRRDIFPTLVKAEYNNRLWWLIWASEWLQARRYFIGLIIEKKKTVLFDPVLLAKGQVHGFMRIGQAAKLGKAKQAHKFATLGVPKLFVKYLYATELTAEFPYRILISDESRKKMGKRAKKKKK